MMTERLAWALAALAVLAAGPGVAAAKDKVKRQRAEVVLPIVVEAATEPASRVYSFRQREFWGWQPARYRSAVTLESAVPIPELGGDAGMAAGERLVELQAKSKNFSGSLFCTGREPRSKPRVPGGLFCLADRDGDGRMDELWTAAGSPKYLVPFPYARSQRPIVPVAVKPVEDRASLALQFGFFVSGNNPIFGTHHFYPMLSTNNEVGVVFTQWKNSVTIKELPNVFGVGGAQISLEGFENKTYRARVTRPYPEGERPLVGEVPTQTVYVYVPG